MKFILAKGFHYLVQAVVWYWDLVRTAPISALVVAGAAVVASAIILRLVFPRPALIVAPFEMPPVQPGDSIVTGRSLAGLMADGIQQIVTRSSIYDQVRMEARRGFKQSFVLFPDPSAVPSVGVEIRGISFARLAAELKRLRYRQMVITGDLLEAQDEFVLTARIVGLGGWVRTKIPKSPHELLLACQKLSEEIMLAINPRLLESTISVQRNTTPHFAPLGRPLSGSHTP